MYSNYLNCLSKQPAPLSASTYKLLRTCSSATTYYAVQSFYCISYVTCTAATKRAVLSFEHYLHISKYDFLAWLVFDLLNNLAPAATVNCGLEEPPEYKNIRLNLWIFVFSDVSTLIIELKPKWIDSQS